MGSEGGGFRQSLGFSFPANTDEFPFFYSSQWEIEALFSRSFSKNVRPPSAICPQGRLSSMRRLLQLVVHLSRIDEKWALPCIWHLPPCGLQGFPDRPAGY